MPTAALSGGVAARRCGAAPAPPPTTAAKRVRPPTSDNSPLASSPLRRPANDAIVVSEGPYKSPTKCSCTALGTPPAASTTPPSTAPKSNDTTARAVVSTTSPLITSVPEDVAKTCGITNSYADALTTALAIVYEADFDKGKAFDTILQGLFNTITSQALRAVTAPPPPAAKATTTAEAATTTTAAANPTPPYASRVPPQTTPLQQQTNHPHSNASPPPATKSPPREEVILHTNCMTSPPWCENIMNAVEAAAGKRVQAVAMRQLPGGDTAAVFPGGIDLRFIKHKLWANGLNTDITITGRKVVIYNVPVDTLLHEPHNLRTKLTAPCPILKTRPMIRRDGPPARSGSLCITVASKADAALLIQEGVILDYQLFRVNPYRKDTRPLICYRCQTWGHYARNCRKPPRCAYCGGGHDSRTCDAL